jgi:hypothetical protein
MKIIACALISLVIVVGFVAPVGAAFDAKTFWDQHDRTQP